MNFKKKELWKPECHFMGIHIIKDKILNFNGLSF